MNKSLKKIIILLVCVLSGGAAVAQLPYIVGLPLPPSAITGRSCVTSIIYPDSLVYSVVGEPGLTYVWTLPPGWTQASGGNTSRITVKPPDYNPSDTLGYIGKVNISVAAKNDIGLGPATTLSGIIFQNIPMPTFASRNLGADPTHNDAKSQMQYLAIPANATVRAADGRVYGGRYQWGRDNKGDYAIDTSTYAIYNNSGLINRQTILADSATYDANGQILTNPKATDTDVVYATNRIDTVFVSPPSVNPFDWRLSTPFGSKKDDLWGNGIAIGSVTTTKQDPGIRSSDNKYYQSTSWMMPQNNPCTSFGAGWRVPTQDELERLLNYECNGQSGVNQAATQISITTSELWGSTNTGFTWVRVANGVPALTWSTANGNGYAVYRTDDWNAAIAAGGYFDGLQKNGTGLATVFATKKLYDTGAPMPFLFLPAAGHRTYTGTTNSVGTGAFYSTSTVTSAGLIHELRFTATFIYAHYTNYRGDGKPVRCVK